MARLRFPPRLTPSVWEKVLPRRAPLMADGTWSRKVVEEGLHLDFARVEFADLAALARALLLIDAAVRDGLQVRVTLPTAEVAGDGGEVTLGMSGAALSEEEASDDAHRQLTRQARARGDARGFMLQVGFVAALHPDHWRNGVVQVDDATMAVDLGAADYVAAEGTQAGPDEAPYQRRRILPFQWLPPLAGEELRDAHAFQAVLARLPDLGLSQTDADALGRTVLVELVQNVAEHAGAGLPGGPPHPLVGAVLLDSRTYARRHDDAPPFSGDLAQYATATSSQVLRLVVGDSGIGLVARLHQESTRHGAAAVEHPFGHRARRTEDTVFRAFGHGSGAPDDADGIPHSPRPGHNGLWRVSHLVQSYGGSVVVRTSDGAAGYVYGETTDGARFTQHALGRAPGTLHEIHILTDPKAHRAPVAWVDQPEAVAGPPLRWVRCVFDPVAGLGEPDRTTLVEAARAAAADPVGGGVVVSMSLRDSRYLSHSARQNALSSALGAASALADVTAVAVLFPDADRRILDLSVSGLHAEESSTTTGVSPRPVLVHGCYGPPIWYGGSKALRAVLAGLSRAGGVVPIEAAVRQWTAAGGAPGDGLWQALDEHRQLFRVNGGQLTLGLSPLSVLRTLDRAVHVELAAAIDEGGEAVGTALGLFRTPGLRITSRWVDSGQLLAGTIGVETGAFVLARKVEAVLRARGEPDLPTVVAHVSAAPRLLAARLSECLSLGGRHHAMPGELDLDGLHPSERIPVGERVVLITDLLSTENTARRAAAAIAGANAEPAVIACVVDARPVRRHIELLNRSIPVVSLTDVVIDIYGADGRTAPTGDSLSADLVDIDPILRHPVIPSRVEAPRVTETEFLEWCTQAPDTLSLGHVAGPRSHSSAMLHLDRALRHPEIGTRITDTVLDVLREALDSINHSDDGNSGVSGGLQLWYAGTPDDIYDSRLPEAVHNRLSELGDPVGPLVAVPRGVAGNRWIFPTATQHDARGQTVVVVDGRATTGTTLSQMIRLAAASGASAVVAVVLLDRLDDQEAAALRTLRAVAPPDGGAPVPALVRFVSTSSIPGESPHDCAICATRVRVQDDSAAPGRLRRHAERVYDLLRPRRREEVFSSAAADLFTVPVGSDDVIDYIRWRSLLRRGLRDTASRQLVVDRLSSLLDRPGAGEFTRDNLIRLLAAEQQWLKLPPLRFTVARELLARICVAGLSKAVNVSPWLRVQALMVLAATTPQQLTEVLPDLLALALDEPVLVDQMLLECYRLLRRPPNDSPIDVVRLRKSLLRCRTNLGKHRDVRAPALADDYLHVVQELITIADHKASPKPDDAQKAWERLREDLGHAVVRHRLDAGLLRVRVCVEDLEDAAPTEQAVLDARSDWESCTRHLAERALVCLPALHHILAGEYVYDRLGRLEHERLMRLLQNGIGALSEVTERLDRLLRGPRQPDDQDWQSMRFEFLDRIDWWYRMFLATHLPRTGKRAHVVDLVSTAPTLLQPRIAMILDSHGAESDVPPARVDSGPGCEVFCPSALLDEAVEHVLENTERHRIPGAECRIGVSYELPEPGNVQVVLRNTGTRPRSVPGQGLRALNAKLRPFEASLTGRPLAGEPWTFETILTLRLWEGA